MIHEKVGEFKKVNKNQMYFFESQTGNPSDVVYEMKDKFEPFIVNGLHGSLTFCQHYPAVAVQRIGQTVDFLAVMYLDGGDGLS